MSPNNSFLLALVSHNCLLTSHWQRLARRHLVEDRLGPGVIERRPDEGHILHKHDGRREKVGEEQDEAVRLFTVGEEQSQRSELSSERRRRLSYANAGRTYLERHPYDAPPEHNHQQQPSEEGRRALDVLRPNEEFACAHGPDGERHARKKEHVAHRQQRAVEEEEHPEEEEERAEGREAHADLLPVAEHDPLPVPPPAPCARFLVASQRQGGVSSHERGVRTWLHAPRRSPPRVLVAPSLEGCELPARGSFTPPPPLARSLARGADIRTSPDCPSVKRARVATRATEEAPPAENQTTGMQQAPSRGLVDLSRRALRLLLHGGGVASVAWARKSDVRLLRCVCAASGRNS